MHRTTGKNSTIPVCVSTLSFTVQVCWILYCSLPFLCFWEVAVVSKPTFYGKLRAGVFTKCFQTATKIQDSHGLLPSRIFKLFCCDCTHVRVLCRPGAPAAEAMLRCPPVPGEQEGTPSLAALAGVVAGSPWARTAIVLVQAPVFSQFGFFCLKSLKCHCAINEPRLRVSVQCPWQFQCDIAASLPGVAAATSAGLALSER